MIDYLNIFTSQIQNADFKDRLKSVFFGVTLNSYFLSAFSKQEKKLK